MKVVNLITNFSKTFILLVVLFMVNLCLSQIKDFTFDDISDEYFNSYEHFNIYYQEISARETSKGENDVWGNKESDIEQFKRHKMLEDQYLANQKLGNNSRDNSSLYQLDDSVFAYKNKFKTNTNIENVNYDELNLDRNEFVDHSILDNPDLNDPVFNQKKYGGNKRQIPQGHPGMNLDSVISTRHFNGGREKRQNFQNYNNYNNQNSFSFFQYINFSIFGFSISEYFLGFMVLTFAYFYVFGKTFNDKYVNIWFDANKIYFDRFARISVKPDIEPIKNNTELVKDAYNIYKYYAEEYNKIKWFSAVLEFKYRQDTSSLLTSLFFKIEDKVYYRVAINPVEPVPNVFCICGKKDLESIKSSYSDVVSLIK